MLGVPILRSRGNSELGNTGQSAERAAGSPVWGSASLSQSPKLVDILLTSEAGSMSAGLSTADIEARELQRLLDLQQAISEREKHNLELQVSA